MIRKISSSGGTVDWDGLWENFLLGLEAMTCLQALFICSCGQKQVSLLFMIALSDSHGMLEKQSCFLDEKGK